MSTRHSAPAGDTVLAVDGLDSTLPDLAGRVLRDPTIRVRILGEHARIDLRPIVVGLPTTIHHGRIGEIEWRDAPILLVVDPMLMPPPPALRRSNVFLLDDEQGFLAGASLVAEAIGAQAVLLPDHIPQLRARVVDSMTRPVDDFPI